MRAKGVRWMDPSILDAGAASARTTLVMSVRFGFAEIAAVVTAMFGFAATAGCGSDSESAPRLVGGKAGAAGSSGSIEGGTGGSGGSGAAGGLLQLGGGAGASGSVGGIDPCLAAQCGPGQRCETNDGGASCVDNACSDLNCAATEKCEPHSRGGFVCVDHSCTTDVDCASGEFCNAGVCAVDL